MGSNPLNQKQNELNYYSMNLRVDQNFKIDHYLRPIIIIKINDRVENIKEVDQKKYEIILERFHSNAKEAEDMLIEV